jgi:hypothetical protein
MKTCPICGKPIALDTNGTVPTSSTLCPKCSAPTSSVAPSESSQPIEDRPSRPLISQTDSSSEMIYTNRDPSNSSTDPLHTQKSPKTTDTDSLISRESKPRMESELETQKSNQNDEDPRPTQEERAEARKQSLSRQGFVVEEDAHGLRLSGVASRPGGLSSQLSPYDIVRLAAELEGGVVPIDQRKRCPKCEAVVNPGDKRCQWCSEPL